MQHGQYRLWFAAQDKPCNPAEIASDPKKLEKKLTRFLQFHDQRTAGIPGLFPLYVGLRARVNEKIAHLYEPTHPGILRLIKATVDAGQTQGIWTGICGEMAGDPLATVLLVGLGLDILSMSPGLLPEVKEIIRSISLDEANRVASRCLEFETGAEVRDHLKSVMQERLGFLPYWENQT